MDQVAPPKKLGPLAEREEKLAWILLLPTVTAVALVIILPLASIFWISFKPIKLSDLRAPTVLFKESFHGKPAKAGDLGEIRYKLRNSSREFSIENITLKDSLPAGLIIKELDRRCKLENKVLQCKLGTFPGGYREIIKIPVTITTSYLETNINPKTSLPILLGNSDYILTNLKLSLENFKRIFNRKEFFQVLYVTLFYTVFGTLGALVLGLAAALILDKTFKGQAILRGLFLFPYVAPVIAVAFTWVMLLDPFSGSINALLIQMNVIESPINFFGRKPLALIMVTAFEIWRYFPLSFLFILARMQSIDGDMYEAAEMDGASPFQQFFYLSIPMLAGILSVLFLLRFIWTFNKFDDIFLLTGGNAGTRTLTVNVYEQAFAISNIGAGAAVAVVIFACLILFSVFFFRFINREEGL